MRNHSNLYILFFLGFVVFITNLYYSFKTPVRREPIFYFFDNTILLSENKNLILEKIQSIKETQSLAIVQINDTNYLMPLKYYYFVDFIKIFYLPILIGLLNLFFAIWFYESLKDVYFSIFFLLKSLLIYLTLLFMYYKIGILLDIFLFFLSWFILAFLNLQVRFIGKSINTFILLTEATIISIIIFSFLSFDLLGLREILLVWCFIVFYFILFVSLIINLIRCFNPNLDKIDKQKIFSFIFGNLLGTLNLVFLFYIKYIPSAFYLISSFVYPVLIAYSVYRMYLVPNQIIITKTLILGLLTLVFIGIYFIGIYLYTFLFPEEAYKFFFDIIFLILLSLVIEPLRQKLFRIINKRFLIPQREFILSLMRLSKILSRISRPKLAIEQFLSEVIQVLNLNHCYLLLPKNFISNLDLSPNFVKELSVEDSIWKYVKPEKIIATTYILYSTGKKKKLLDFLYKNKILLLIGLGEKKYFLETFYIYFLKIINFFYKFYYKKDFDLYKKKIDQYPQSALMIGYPGHRNKFYISEIRYLQEVARLATIMIYNIYILFREVDKRKKVRYILLSGKFQRKLSFQLKEFPEGVKIEYFNHPVISVSGDYIDILPVDYDHIAVFLGDVSGHGLGSGYLVSSIRSIVHYGIDHHFSLSKIVNMINLFLTNRYKGYEFLTLFAFILEISTGKIEFINSAHPGMYIKAKNQPLYKIEKNQKLLGISESEFESNWIEIEPETKLFLFSDGVIETISPNNELYGEKRLLDFLNQYHSLPINEISKLLINELKEFRQSIDFQDDTTFLIMEYNPKKNIFSDFLRILGFKI